MNLISGLIYDPLINNGFNSFKNVVLIKLTESQKKIALLAVVVFSSCALIYMVYHRCFKAEIVKETELKFQKNIELAISDDSELEIGVGPVDKLQMAISENEIIRPGKRSISQRLEDNRKDAAEQQLQESDKGFSIAAGQVENEYDGSSIQVNQVMVNRKPTGIASTQGLYRPTMEDADIATHASFRVDGEDCPFDLWGVFDGHGGANASKFVKKNIVAYLKKELEASNSSKLTQQGIFSAIKKCFIALDQDYSGDDGTTATVAIRLAGQIFVANVGDSRTILVDKNGKAIQATEDAKPIMQKYSDKIRDLGGFVFWDRVNGELAVARAVGDKGIVSGKTGKCCVSPNPKITCYSEEEFADGYLVLACDGVTDVASTNEIGKGIYEMAQRNESVQEMSTKIVYHALKNGSKDNISAIVVKL